MKYVILGGGGFIGSAIADRLLVDGHQLRILERVRVIPYREFSENEKVEWVKGDFANSNDIADIIDGVDIVLHLASTTLPKSSNDDPINDVQSNVVATLQLLNTMVARKVPKIIFISSGGTVYGPPTYLPIDEKHPTEPMVSYGITKLTIEKYLRVFEHLHGIRAIILRVSNPYGERQRLETAQGAVGVFLGQALKGLPIQIWGDGTIIRDYVYVGDVADAFARAGEYTGTKNIFNISSGVGTSLNDLIDMLENIIGNTVERRYLPGRTFDVPVSVLSNGLAREELKWAPSTPLAEGIVRTAKWMQRELARDTREQG